MKAIQRVTAGIVTGILCVFMISGCAQSTQPENESSSLWETIPESAKAGESETVTNKEQAETLPAGETPEGESTAAQAAEAESAQSAQTEEPSAAQESSQEVTASAETTQESETPQQVTDNPVSAASFVSSSETLSTLVSDFMNERGLNADNFAVSFKNLQTGEVFYFNELKQWDACSTYKLPLNLLYYDMEAAGQMTEDTIVPGTNTPLSECHHQSLEFSNNELSEAMMDNLGSYDQVKRNMRKYFTLTDQEIDDSYYYHNYFCARMMMEIAEYLYLHQSEYSDAMKYLLAAQPGMYFRKYLPSDVQIAQKYGLRDGYTHDAGIIFGQVPFVLSVYSYQAGGEDMIARCAELFYNYAEQQ